MTEDGAEENCASSSCSEISVTPGRISRGFALDGEVRLDVLRERSRERRRLERTSRWNTLIGYFIKLHMT